MHNFNSSNFIPQIPFRISFYLLIPLFFIVVTPIHKSFAQYNVIKVDGFSLVYPNRNVFRAGYERNIKKYVSVSFNFESGRYATGLIETYGSSGVVTSSSEIYSLKGWGFMPEVRAYPFGKKKDSPIGFFFGLHLRHRQLKEKYTGQDYTVPNNFGSYKIYADLNVKGSLTDIGLNFGYKGKIGNTFIFEPLIGFGTGIVSGFSSEKRAKMDPFYATPINSGWNLLRVQFSIGIVFPKIEYGLPQKGE